MKFLLFNVTVGFALVYLLTGGDISRLNLPHNVSEKLNPNTVRELIKEHTPDAVKHAMKKIAAPEQDEKQEEATAAPSSPPAMPKEVKVAKHTPVPPQAVSPAVHQYKPEPQLAATPSAKVSSQDTATDASTPEAMNRQQALQNLIRDMERMANDKLLR